MILFHTHINKIAIEKYKDRKVYIRHIEMNLWMGKSDIGILWTNKNEREELTFKQALKKTKHFHHGLEYHFISQEIGNEKPMISEFEPEEIYNFMDIKFDNQNTHQSTRKAQHS
jgi:hypothetical protein